MAKNRLIKSTRGNGFGILDEETNMVTPISIESNQLIESKKGNGFGIKFGDSVVPVDISGLASSDLSLFQKKNPDQSGMGLSGAGSSTAGTQEDKAWYESAYDSVKDFAVSIAKGAYNNSADYGIALGRNLMVGLVPDMFWGKEKMTYEQKADAYNKNIAANVEKVKGEFKEGSSANIFTDDGSLRLPDADALGEVVGRQMMQLGLNAGGLGGFIMNHLSNTEANYREAKEKGLSEKEAFVMSNSLGLTETLMDKLMGAEKLYDDVILGGAVKKVGKYATSQIVEKLLSYGAFKTGIETGEGALKRAIKQGVLPEMADEFLQTYAGEGEKMLFDKYKEATSDDNPNTKLNLYDADMSSSKTFFSAINSAFIGGLIGGTGATLIGTNKYSPTVYASLLNSYDSQGKEGLEAGVMDIKKGVDKSFARGEIDSDAYNNALKNIDKIAENISKFEQKSKVDPYSRFVLYDQTERIIPETAKGIARTLAEATTPLELPTQGQIDDDIKNENISLVQFANEKQVPAPYKPYIETVTDEQGNNYVEAKIPNSVVKAYNANQMAIQEAMNNPLFAIDSLTNNNNVVTIEDLQRIGQQGGVQGDLSSQMNFNIAFEANKSIFQTNLKVINYAKSIANKIASGQTIDQIELVKGYANIIKFNKGDTVFYNNKSAKIMEVSPDGQMLRLSGIKEMVSANDNDILLRDAVTGEAFQPQTEQEEQKAEPTKSKLGTQFDEWNAFASQNPVAFATEARLFFGDNKSELTEAQAEEAENLIASQLEKGAKASDIVKNLKDLGYSTQDNIDAENSFSNYLRARESGNTQATYVGIHKPAAQQQKQAPAQKAPLAEEEQITGRTMREAVGELIPFTYKGETGELYTQSNGVVTFESPKRIVEFGNIKDIGDQSIDEYDLIPQEMSIGDNYSVTIDGKTFTNKNQNPFKAITYDENGDAVSVKLQDEKGKTKVIKGARAVLIDAKYKVKKLYDESTRDQLAAAAEDAANQAAAIEDTRGEPTEAPTPRESKPTEQAPTVAERESQERIKQIAKRLAEAESEQATRNRESVANLVSSLFSSGIQVEVLNSEQIRIKYNKNVPQGMFISNNGTIVINESVLESEWGKTIIFHEGTHPIINIIRNTEPKLYRQLVDAIKEEAKTNPEVNNILAQIKSNPIYKEEFTQNDELLVEAIARVASGKLNLNEVKPTLRQAIVNFINKIGKMMGFKQVLKDSNQVALTKLANQISEVLNAGRDISEIVGSENVKKFANEETQFRVNEVFEGILEQLGISAAKESKKGVTNYGVASALNKYYNEKFEKLAVDDFSENALKIVSDYATDEVIFAMQKFGDKSGKGWYTDDFSNAVDKLSEIYPAIKEKEDVREVANIIIAIASNSTDVSTNLMRVVYGLEQYQKTGKIPSDIGTGKAMSAIATTINRYNRLLETFDNNPVKVKEFLQTIRPISESKQAIVEHLGVGSFAQVLKSDYATNPDWADSEVLPTSIIIFGPKIGAFYSNLSGLGGTPTIDRWCIRTMFRYRGDMRAKVLDVDLNKFIEANNLQGQAKASVLAVAEAHAKEFDRLLGARGAYASLSKEQRNAEMAKYRKGKEIYSKSADVVNDIKDGLTDEIKNKAQFAKDFRTFTKNTFEKVQENILKSTGEKLDISDIQAILWIYEKNLFGFLGVKQREDATYSSAANRIISSINNGNVSLNDVVNGKAKLADMKLDGIVEEGAMGDQYLINEEDYKNGIDANKGNTNIEEQYSDIDRSYTPEGTVADAGMTMEERKAWQEKNRVSQRQERNPIVQKGVENLKNGLITLDSYINIVRENMPIFSMPEVPKIPTFKEIVSALNEGALSKGGIVGLNKTFKDGERVASRLDIPAYNAYDTWVVSIHEGINNKINGKVLGYGQTAVLKNVDFVTNPKGAMNIAIDKDKATIARIYGDWVNEAPELAHKRATELMNDPQWVQVGMNPYRHSFFYDKATGEALLSAEEVIQVGALVLAKNPVRAPFGSQAFTDNFSFINELGQKIQFSDLSRDDKRIQTIRREFSTYPKGEIVQALMGAPFNLSQEKAEDLVNRAFADPLAPSLPTGNPDTAIPEGSNVNQRSRTVEEYNSGYNKYKKMLLENTVGRWKKLMNDIALEYDSKFFARRKLGLATSGESLAQAQLRNLNGIAYSASQDLAVLYENIFGNGLSEEGISNLDAMIFNLRILQVDRNTERKRQDEVERLTVEFIEKNNRLPRANESAGILAEATRNVPIKAHGLTRNGEPATSQTAQQFLDDLRNELGENGYNMLKTRADLFKKAGNDLVQKLRKAGIISNEVAESYKDDFYAFRMTLDRLYGKEDTSIFMMNGVPAIKGWTALSKTGTENYINQDARLMLAQSYIGTSRAIAKNAFRESVFNENIKTDENGNQQSVLDINGKQITFVKPANYIRDADGNIRSNGKELSVREADEGYVNVPFKKDGVVNYYQMEAETFSQLEGNNIVWNDAKDNGAIWNRYYSITDVSNRLLTGFATRNNPFFWIGNVPMDLQQQIFFTDIWTQGSLAQSNVYVAGARALARTIKFSDFFGLNKEYVDKTLEEYIAAGGAMDRLSTMKEQRQRSIEMELSPEASGSKIKQIMRKGKKGLKTGLSYMNEKTEIAMRLAAYDQSKKNLIKKFEEENNGAKPNEAQMKKIQEIAAAKSRAYTDFAQRGVSLPNLNVAYLNSSIQAAGAAAEYIYDNPKEAASKVTQLAIGKFVSTVALMALMGDAYDELDEYRKDMYSFLFSWDTGKKDEKGNPIYVTADIRNNPSLTPALTVSRVLAERTMRAFQGKEQEDITVLGTAESFVEKLNQALPIPIPNVFSLEGLKKSGLQLITKHALTNGLVKAFMGYDAFRNREIVSKRDEELSPYMQGMDDPDVAYFYKTIAKSMSGFSSAGQISPAKMQSVAETFITSPKTNGLVGLMYMTLSDVANAIIPAKTENERGQYSWSDVSKIAKSLTGRFATFTDAEKAEFRKNEQLYIMSREESMRYNDSERIIDNQLKDLYKKDPANFFTNVDKMAKEEGYWDDDLLMSRIDKKAENLDNGNYDKTFIKDDILNEVKILHYTKGIEGKAKLLKYMFDNDSKKATEVIDGMINYGTPANEAYDTEDLYLQMIKKK